MIPLALEDALLLCLVTAYMCIIVMGDLTAHLRSRSKPNTTGGGPECSANMSNLATGARAKLHRSHTPETPLVADMLLVDDSAVARAMLRKLFVRGGYSVQLASDGVEALALLQKGRYALMITDLEMPNMGGTELIHECRRQPHTASMPIIAVSSHENLRVQFNECRYICGVHRKPWVDDILLSHVGTVVGTRRPSTSSGGPCMPSAA